LYIINLGGDCLIYVKDKTYYNSREIEYILEEKIKNADNNRELMRYRILLKYIRCYGKKIYKLPLTCEIIKEVQGEFQQHIENKYIDVFDMQKQYYVN
jgi:hypothetical protein